MATRGRTGPSTFLTFLAFLALAASALAQDAPPPSIAAAAERFAAGEDQAAAELLAPVVGPDRPWADYYLGRIELRRDAVDAAIERLAAAVAATPDNALFQRWLGEAYVAKIDTVNAFAKLGPAKKAREHFLEAVRLAPTDYAAREALVGFYLNAPTIAGGSAAKAAEQVAELKALDAAGGHALEGRLHFGEGEWAEAEAAFRRALAADGDNAGYHYLAGFSQQQQQEYGRAFASFETALSKDPGLGAARYQIGRTAIFAEANLDRGVECLEDYLAAPAAHGEPAHQHAWWRLGMLHELQGETGRARDAYRSALEVDPEHEEARKALAALGPAPPAGDG